MLIRMVEEHEQSEDKNDSEMSNIGLSQQAEKIIVELNSMHGEAKKKILELIEQLRNDKLKDHEIKKVLFDRVSFVGRSTLYNALPQEFKREYTKPQSLPKTINISTPHKVIEQSDHDWHYEQGEKEEEAEIKKIGEIRRAEQKREAEEPIKPPEELAENEVGEIDYWKEKAMELEEALKKTQQFTPATQLQQQQEPATDEHYFKWLADKADGNVSFYYDTYGIDLFKNRELPQLKNRGVKTFKRLFFEV